MFMLRSRASPNLPRVRWSKTLYSALDNNELEIVEHALTQLELSPREGDKVLAIASRSPEMLKIVLQGLCIDPTRNLLGLIRKTCPSLECRSLFKSVLNKPSLSRYTRPPVVMSEEATDILAKDNRVRTEELTVSMVRAFVWSLDKSIEDNVAGFILGSRIANDITCERVLGTVIEGTSTYSQLSRHILLKRPSSSDLMSWIQDQNNVYLQVAGNGCRVLDARMVAFRALMIVLHYPNTKLRTLLNTLVDEELGQECLILSGRLVGLYLGAERLAAEDEC